MNKIVEKRFSLGSLHLGGTLFVSRKCAKAAKKIKNLCPALLFLIFMQVLAVQIPAQIAIDPAEKIVAPNQILPHVNATAENYLDPVNGMTADGAVLIALERNGEINALAAELDAAEALIKQAGLRPNPRLQIGGTQESFVGSRYSGMVSASVPLELGGRRAARINVAENEFRVRTALLENQKRELAAEVRNEFGEALALIEKLRFLEELLANVEQGYQLVAARVSEGKTAPLEENMTLVEVNRLRSMRETAIGEIEVKLLELRNLLGVDSNELLRINGDFDDLMTTVAPLSESVSRAILERPDLAAVRLTREVAAAELEQARAEGRLDAGVSLGFQRMTRVTPRLVGTDPLMLDPQMIGENFITFGVDLLLPVRNRNQGAVEAAGHRIAAAERRLEFGELTIRREVTAAYRRYERAVRALTIYQVGVRNQARENLQVVWQTYELGQINLLDYIAEERRYLDLENSLVDARLEAYLAKTEILRVTSSPELITK